MIEGRTNKIIAFLPTILWLIILFVTRGTMLLQQGLPKTGYSGLLIGMLMEGFFQGLPFLLTTAVCLEMLKSSAPIYKVLTMEAIMLSVVLPQTLFLYGITFYSYLHPLPGGGGDASMALGFLLIFNNIVIWIGKFIGNRIISNLHRPKV